MTYEQLVSQIEGADLHSIRVEEIESSHTDLEFAGDLYGFLKAAKALRAEIIFVSVMSLSESAFGPYVPNTSNQGIENGDDPTDGGVDLCEVLPDLKKFKKEIGVPGQFDLLIPTRNRCLTFSVVEDWWVNFVECFSDARLLADQRWFEQLNERRAEEEIERNKVREKLRRLVSDTQFCKLPTQIAMREYALEKIPELAAISESELKQEIQTLKAKIQVHR